MVRRMISPSIVASLVLAIAMAPKPAAAQAPLVSVTDINITSVVVQAGQLVANATVTLDVVGRTVTRTVQIPLGITTSPGPDECEILHLELGPLNLDLLGLVVNLDDCEGGPVVVDITADPEGGLLGSLLCALAGALDGGLGNLTDAQLGALAQALNAILDELLGTPAAAAAHQVIAQQQAQRRCDILTLEIPGGIHLDLLGAMIDTSGICLDVFAEQGRGNLLGNLLCGLTNLLNSGGNTASLSTIIASIHELLDLLGL